MCLQKLAREEKKTITKKSHSQYQKAKPNTTIYKQHIVKVALKSIGEIMDYF